LKQIKSIPDNQDAFKKVNQIVYTSNKLLSPSLSVSERNNYTKQLKDAQQQLQDILKKIGK
jgi:hypothetical protein